jgi:hypothetical protein
MDGARATGAPFGETERSRRIGLDRQRALDVDQALAANDARRGGERRSEQCRIEGRVEKDEVDARRRGARKPLQRVGALDAHRLGVQSLASRVQAGDQRRVALEQDHFGGAARRRLEAERPRAGERVDAAPAVERLAEPVEERLAHAVGGRPEPRAIANRQLAALPGAADDPHFARKRVAARTRFRRSRGGARLHGHGRTETPSRASSAFASPTENSP